VPCGKPKDEEPSDTTPDGVGDVSDEELLDDTGEDARIIRTYRGRKPTPEQLKAIYREALRRALEDGVITDDEENILEGLRNILGVSRVEHARFMQCMGYNQGRRLNEA
jgi:hypothetical protein